MRDFLAITKALSDENRVRAMVALGGGELCVCQLIELLGLAPSTVSKHMAILHQARLVESRKDGRWMFYQLATESDEGCVRAAIGMAQECLADDRTIREDARRLASIRRMSRDELCACYHERGEE